MGVIEVGTAGWTDKSLVDSGLFYPAAAKSAEDRLRYYASLFQLVEVDSSYYGLPSENNARLWAERTPEHFRFNVKAFRLFTGHQTPPAALPKDIRAALGEPTKNQYYKDLPAELKDELWLRFRSALEPLRSAGKLGIVHFQMAPWMAYHPENLEHMRECQEKLPGDRMALEFRNRTWFDERHAARTLAFEREHGFTNVVVDEPQGFASSVPAVWEATTPELALVRLHGRNAQTWNKKGLKASSERFDYDYSDDELATLARSVRTLSDQVQRVDVILNNNYQDQGQRNALTLGRLLES